jgi:sensor histidine kinase YesM
MNAKKITTTLINFTIISIIVAVFIRFINFVSNDYDLDILLNFTSYLISFIYAMFIGLANAIGFGIIYAKYTWERDAKKLVIIGVIGSVAWSTLGFFFARYTHLVLIEGYSFSKFIEQESFLTYLFSMMIAFIITLIFHVLYFYKALQDSKLKEKTFESESNSAKFDALKNQLDPHFLFNSLNVLSALIDENPEKAQDFTIGLSQVYRYVLDQKHKDLVHLSEEIKFADTYLDLLKMRFENSIEVKIDKRISEIDAKVIPLSLQLLLENAIKHNTISEKLPLYIDIYIENSFLIIKNNYQPKIGTSAQKRNGIGLDNIKSRYKLFTDIKCQIQKTDNMFLVKLPLLQLQTL